MNEFQIKNYIKLENIYRITGKLVYVKNKLQIIHPTGVLNNKDFFISTNLNHNTIYQVKRLIKKFSESLLKII